MLDDIPYLKPGRDPQTIADNVITLIKAGFSRAEAKESALAVAGVRIPDGLSVIRFKLTAEGLLHSQIDTAVAPMTEPQHLPLLKSGKVLEIMLENGRTLVKHGFSKHSALEIAFGFAGYPLPSPFAGATLTESSSETDVDDAPVDLTDQKLQEILVRYQARKATEAAPVLFALPSVSDQARMSSERHLLADQIENRLVKGVISLLQEMKDCRLSGDDSVLENTWDEICVQVQDEESAYWDSYDDTVHSLVEASLGRLLPIELQAVWLQTEAGSDWSCDNEQSQDEIPVCVDQVTSRIVQRIYDHASNWSNRRIRKFLEREHD